MPKLSINLLTFNGEKYLDPCFESVRCQSFRDFQILVIDNGSQDKTREKIEEWRKIFEGEGIEFKTVYLEKNLGFTEGHNRGFKFLIHSASSGQASNFKFQNNEQIFNFKSAQIGCLGEFQNTDLIFGTGHGKPHPNPPLKGEGIKYVCCLNQDIILRSEYLEKLVVFMDKHPECGSASGKLMRIMDDNLFFDILNANGREYESELTRKFSLPRTLISRGSAIDYARLAQECNIIDSVGLKIFKSHRFIEKGHSEKDEGQYDKITEVFGVPGTVPLFRMEALDDIKISQKHVLSGAEGSKACPEFAERVKSQKFGKVESLNLGENTEAQFEYFDSDFGSYKDDVDTSYRLRWRGWKIFVVPEAVAYHKRGARQLKNKLDDFTAAFNRKNKPKYINYLSQRNHIWTLVKNMDTLNLAVIWYEAKKFGYEMIFEWSTFKAWFDIWKKMGVMREKRRWIMGNRRVGREEIERWFS
ncbi:MAG: glycosyltransferase [bacterium]